MTFIERLNDLGYASYGAYLRGDHWREVRARYLASGLHKDRCHACSAVVPLNVHHLTYARIGHEYLTDLVALCSDCHKAVHALEKTRGRRLASVTRWYIRDRWRREGTRPKGTGQWSKREQRAAARRRRVVRR